MKPVVPLASGETAIVIRVGATAHTPLVVALTDRSGVPTVNALRRDTAQAAFKVTGTARGGHLAVPSAERLYGLER